MEQIRTSRRNSSTDRSTRFSIVSEPDSPSRAMAQAASGYKPDPLVQARVLLAEQSENFDAVRSAIGRIGQSLAHLSESKPDARRLPMHIEALCDAHAEAVQGLALLALNSHQAQLQLVQAVEARCSPSPVPGVPKAVYYALGAAILLSLTALGIASLA